jgi:eukaryotic-like serine/threonine-protein kinase
VAKGLDPTLIGRTIGGKFLIESFIGGGAMGAVYRARQVALDKVVAVKVLHREFVSDESFVARFKREAKAASRLDHPNSMRVIDFGSEPDGLLYLAMEHLDGRDLLQVIVEDWPLSSLRIAGILSQALAALAVAHDMGVVHRDLKPENIMVLKGLNDEGVPTDVVKVCDFGIAKITQHREGAGTDGGGPLTAQGLVVGTPEYMSPEQGKGETLDPRSDLYSMGVILYQLLSGRVPFEAESALGIVFKHVTEEPIPPSRINPLVDRRLEALCLRAMQKKREDRPQSAREMRAELRVLSDSTSVPIPPSTFGADDTAPSPAPSSSAVARAVTDRVAPLDPLPKTTSSATFLDARSIPRSSPSRLLLGLALAALAGVAAVTVLVRAPAPAGEAPTPSSSNSAAVLAPAMLPATAAVDSGSSELEPQPATAAAASAEPPTLRAPGPSKAPLQTSRGQAVARGESRSKSASPDSQTPPPTGASSSFNLTTASASTTVLAATGASPRDVRRALPSWQFTVCYRDAMKRLGHRLEGKMTVHIKMGIDGTILKALVSGPADLTSPLADCVGEALTNLPVPAAAGAGGEADLSIVFLPN